MVHSGKRKADGEARLVSLVRQGLLSLRDASAGVVVAVSGGADSVALLRALEAARDPGAPIPLILAHLNHQLRGTESDADEELVVRLHAQLSAAGRPWLSLSRTRMDMAACARAEGANLEALARRERYRWLAETARAHGARWIATGHTANDQAETVLHRLLRGTGLRGLRGIAPQRELEPGVTVVRPLLRATRTEIVTYLRHVNQPYREDETNRDTAYTRNRLRHELLPHLAQHYNPAIVTALAQLAEQADEAYRIEEFEARGLLTHAELPRAGNLLVFDRSRLVTAHCHRVRELFRLVWLREGWPLSDMDRAAWERVAQVVFDGPAAVDLPGNIRIRRRERVVQVGRVGSRPGLDERGQQA